MSTKRQQIMTAIDARFKGITQANGYQTDLGDNIFPWRTTTLVDTELPAICYRDSDSKKYDETVGEIIRELLVEITVTMAEGNDTPEEVRRGLADVYKAIAVDVTWGGLAEDTVLPDSDSIQLVQTDKIEGGAQITISILYSTNRWEI